MYVSAYCQNKPVASRCAIPAVLRHRLVVEDAHLYVQRVLEHNTNNKRNDDNNHHNNDNYTATDKNANNTIINSNT